MPGLIARAGRRARESARAAALLRNWPALVLKGHAPAGPWALKFRNGVVIEAPPRGQLDFLFYEVWVRESYVPPGYEIGPGEIVVDVGANLGIFAAFAATRAPGVRVVAYEPSPEVFPYLRRNLTASRLGNVEAVQAAVAGEAGVRPFSEGGNAMLGTLGVAGGPGVAVRCVGLADLFATHGLDRCDLLKLDCEGAEYEILERCPPDTLSRVRRIVGEYHQGEDRVAGRLSRTLEGHGWRIDRMEPLDPSCGFFAATNLKPQVGP